MIQRYRWWRTGTRRCGRPLAPKATVALIRRWRDVGKMRTRGAASPRRRREASLAPHDRLHGARRARGRCSSPLLVGTDGKSIFLVGTGGARVFSSSAPGSRAAGRRRVAACVCARDHERRAAAVNIRTQDPLPYSIKVSLELFSHHERRAHSNSQVKVEEALLCSSAPGGRGSAAVCAAAG